MLTRLPPPLRADPRAVHDGLRARLSSPPLALAADTHVGLLEEMVRAGLSGGATYDALIGVTAREAGARLLTRDARAVRVYEALRVPHRVIGADVGRLDR